MPQGKKLKKDFRTDLEKQGISRCFKMSDGVEIRVLDFNIASTFEEYIIMLIPGFVTAFHSWERVTELLAKEHRVLYFESREKSSSIMPKKMERKITFARMAYDIKEVINQLELNEKKYLILCSSLGGNILTKALAMKWIAPSGAVMVGPGMEFHFNWFVVILSAIIPNFIKQSILKPVIRWYLSIFYVNKKKEPEQLEKYMRAIEECNMRKAMPLFRKMYRHKSWSDPPKVETPVLLIGASADKMHATQETLKVHELMPNSIYVDLGSNKAAHEEPIVIEIKKFIQFLESKKNKEEY